MLDYIAVGKRVVLRAGQKREAACGSHVLEGWIPPCDGHGVLCSMSFLWLGHLKLINCCTFLQLCSKQGQKNKNITTSLQSILMKSTVN